MGQVKGDADFIAVGTELHTAGDDHKAGDIGLGKINILRQDAEAVDGGSPAAGNGGKGRIGTLGHMLGGHRSVVVGQALPVRVGGEELAGLLKALGVGVHLADIREAAAGNAQQAVLNLDLGLPDNVAVVLGQEVVNCGDGAGGAVLNGEDAVVCPLACEAFKDILG